MLHATRIKRGQLLKHTPDDECVSILIAPLTGMLRAIPQFASIKEIFADRLCSLFKGVGVNLGLGQWFWVPTPDHPALESQIRIFSIRPERRCRQQCGGEKTEDIKS